MCSPSPEIFRPSKASNFTVWCLSVWVGLFAVTRRSLNTLRCPRLYLHWTESHSNRKGNFGYRSGYEKFDQYIYGRKVFVETDHKPLVSITKKPVYSAPKRLQKMLLRLQKIYLQKRSIDAHCRCPIQSIPKELHSQCEWTICTRWKTWS